MSFPYTTVRGFIQTSVADRKSKNPHYTTSAFAKRIGLSPAMLTEVLKGRKFLSKERCYEVARELKLSALETEYLGLVAEFETTKDPDLKTSIERQIEILKPSSESTDRYFASHAFPVSKADFDRIRNLAEQFIREITDISERANHADSAYQIDVRLYELTQIQKTESAQSSELKNKFECQTHSSPAV